MNSFLKFGLIAALTLSIIYGGVRLYAYQYVQPDEIGIWMTNGGYNGVSDYQVWQGSFPFDISPATKPFILPGNPWTIDMPIREVLSKENGKWIVDPSMTFSVVRKDGPTVCHMFNSYLSEGKDSFLADVGEHFLLPIVNNTYVEIIGKNRDTLMMNDKMGIAQLIEDSIKVRFGRLGFQLNNFVTGVKPPESILKTKEAENASIQAVFTSRAKTIESEANAKVMVANAKASAEAMLVEERANAEATRLKQQAAAISLNPLMIQKMWIDKWDGALPYYQTGAGNGLMMQMPKQ